MKKIYWIVNTYRYGKIVNSETFLTRDSARNYVRGCKPFADTAGGYKLEIVRYAI